jgi:hypothetical protein
VALVVLPPLEVSTDREHHERKGFNRKRANHLRLRPNANRHRLVTARGVDAGVWLGADHGFSDEARKFAVSIVIAVAFVKVFLVGRHFMELRTAPILLNLVFGGWVLGVAGSMIGVYLLA